MASIQALLDELVGSQEEAALQVAAWYRGRPVLELAAGEARPGLPVTGSTRFVAFSVTKALTATLIHQLAAQGALELAAPVARYWPEYAAAGKGEITVAMVLDHTAGVPQLPVPMGPADLGDWEGMTRRLAELAPLWPPGSVSAYHALSFGWILGEVARRVTGQDFRSLFQAALVEPLGLRDTFLGMPHEQVHTVTPLVPSPPMTTKLRPDDLMLQALPLSVTPGPRVFNRPEVLTAVIPGGGLISTARDLARFGAALLAPVDGVRLLDAATLERAIAPRVRGLDPVLDLPLRKGLGFFLGGEGSLAGLPEGAFGHPGAGGTLFLAWPEAEFSFALLKNRLIWEPSAAGPAATRVARAVLEELGRV